MRRNPRWLTCLTFTMAAPLACHAGDEPQDEIPSQSSELMVWSFNNYEAGTLPEDWLVGETRGSGKPATWQVVADPTAPSPPNIMRLVRSENRGDTFNLLLADKSVFDHLDLSVRMRADSGVEDQGGGLVWKCKDEKNYYICRLNPLEGNFRLYKVTKGKRKQLESANIDAEVGRWYELRVVTIGRHISCYVDGERLLTTKDESIRGPGRIGLWTKADAASSFDEVRVTNKVDVEALGLASDDGDKKKGEKEEKKKEKKDKKKK
jgi:hypothetical protein